MKPDLIILTNSFPNTSARAEDWLNDELQFTSRFYEHIVIVPEYFSGDFLSLPLNCRVMDATDLSDISLTVPDLANCFKIVVSDFWSYSKKSDFFKSFRYNLALLKNLQRKAKKIANMNKHLKNVILYAYWADNLATTGCMIRQKNSSFKVVTRGHGYEIFEEQTRHGIIPFRKFQNRYLTRLFADSKRGMHHLNEQNNTNPEINSVSYVGTRDQGIGAFDSTTGFSMLTCSHVRSVKRLLLMPDILKYIDFDLTWHVLGDGEELEALKQKCSKLPENIKVIFYGYLKNEEILDFYKNHSINLFVSLSYSEGLPVSMMEAQSFGMPIMSTNVGGCKEICNEKTGFLIERDFDAAAVAKGIKDFKDSDRNSLFFRQKCRQNWQQNFNAEINYTNFAKDIISL